jgi:predicted enzyme related to lactoylglutathione lyase
MTDGLKTIVLPVTDLAKAKTLYRELLGVDPSSDEPYYVGFTVGDQHVGLDPNGHRDTGAVGYWHVDDIKASFTALLDAAAQPVQDVHDVGGGRLIATVKDADGNVIGLLQP